MQNMSWIGYKINVQCICFMLFQLNNHGKRTVKWYNLVDINVSACHINGKQIEMKISVIIFNRLNRLVTNVNIRFVYLTNYIFVWYVPDVCIYVFMFSLFFLIDFLDNFKSLWFSTYMRNNVISPPIIITKWVYTQIQIILRNCLFLFRFSVAKKQFQSCAGNL